MSTRSQIGILHADGSIDAHYCHSDGYWSWNGKRLHTLWQNRQAIQQLIDLGMMSNLGEVIGKKHDFDWEQKGKFKYATVEAAFKALPKAERDKYEDNSFIYRMALKDADPRSKYCRFYGRDRKEKDVEPQHYASIDEMAASGAFEEYVYLWDDVRGCWVGARTGYQSPASSLVWHRLSDLEAFDWKDHDEDDKPLPVPTIDLLGDRVTPAGIHVPIPLPAMARSEVYATF